MRSKILIIEILLILAFLLIGGFLRFFNLNWDHGHYFHPDERNIAAAVSRIHFFDALDPQFFAYGGLSIYLDRATGELLIKITHDSSWVSDWTKINLISRAWSALFATLTIIPLYLLARKIFNRATALLSIVLWTFTPSAIQTAHFGVTESMLTFWGVLIALLSIRLLEQPTIKRYLVVGTILGIATATKTSAISLIIFPGIAWIIDILKNRRFFLSHLWHISYLLESAVISFLLFSPFTLISWQKFLESMTYESGVTTGRLIVPYTLQFTHTPAYLYQLVNLIWQAGPIALLVFPSLIFLAIALIKHKNPHFLLFLAFPLIYFGYVGSWHTKFIRYMMPVLPFFIIGTVYLLDSIRRRLRILGIALIVILIIPSVLWGLAFFTVYTRPQTRILASEWIYQNIPSGSFLLGEHWDDGLPVDLPNQLSGTYRIDQLKIYDSDNQAKIDYLTEQLSQGDYLIFNSRRLYGTLLYLPDKYPITSQYYRLLFRGELGYRKVAEFTSYPNILGVTINDDLSEETFQVYDHPKVMIYQNLHTLSRNDYLNILHHD